MNEDDQILAELADAALYAATVDRVILDAATLGHKPEAIALMRQLVDAALDSDDVLPVATGSLLVRATRAAAVADRWHETGKINRSRLGALVTDEARVLIDADPTDLLRASRQTPVDRDWMHYVLSALLITVTNIVMHCDERGRDVVLVGTDPSL